MGWTSYTIEKGAKTDEVLRREFTQSTNGGTRAGFEVIDSATVGSVWYAVMKYTDHDTSTTDGTTRAREVYYGLVCLTERKTPRGSRQTEFSFKDMDEAMMPFYFDCPPRLLDLLDKHAPNPEGSAAKWRERCRARQAQKNQTRREIDQAKKQLRAFLQQHLQIIRIGA